MRLINILRSIISSILNAFKAPDLQFFLFPIVNIELCINLRTVIHKKVVTGTISFNCRADIATSLK